LFFHKAKRRRARTSGPRARGARQTTSPKVSRLQGAALACGRSVAKTRHARPPSQRAGPGAERPRRAAPNVPCHTSPGWRNFQSRADELHRWGRWNRCPRRLRSWAQSQMLGARLRGGRVCGPRRTVQVVQLQRSGLLAVAASSRSVAWRQRHRAGPVLRHKDGRCAFSRPG